MRGYEDLNDDDQLRRNPLMQTAVGQAPELGCSPTLPRLETRAARADIVALHRVLLTQFIASYERLPTELVLDLDASDIPLHGDQEQDEFHAYYGHYCNLPLYVYCGKAMLARVLRRSRIDGARHATAVVKQLMMQLRIQWPKVRLIVRDDSDFRHRRLIRWYECQQVGCVIGVARNVRFRRRAPSGPPSLPPLYASPCSRSTKP